MDGDLSEGTSMTDSTSTVHSKMMGSKTVSIPPSPSTVSFNPGRITVLNLSELGDVRESVLESGCLPQWITSFTNLNVLRATKLGIQILEPWILELRYLDCLDLEHNLISTWPHFLRDSKSLLMVNLDGNPCLEKAFDKSPSLRSVFFSWSATQKINRSLPGAIRGPEWPPAASARINNSSSIRDLGFFCGGIYTLSTPPESSDDGLLTPLDPCPLQTRRYGREDSSLYTPDTPLSPMFFNQSTPELTSTFSNGTSFMAKGQPLASPISDKDGKGSKKTFNPVSFGKHSRILFEVFDDIAVLLNRNEYRQELLVNVNSQVLLVGSPQDSFNRMIPHCEHLTILELLQHCNQLLKEEDLYIQELQMVKAQFCDPSIKSTLISNSLRAVFTGFPAMLAIHIKHIRPALESLIGALEPLTYYGKHRGPVSLPAHVERDVEQLTEAFKHLHRAVASYAGNICKAEFLLNTPRSTSKLYEDADFGTSVQSRVWRLGGLIGHIGAGITSTASITHQLGVRSTARQFPAEVEEPYTVLSNWLGKQYDRPHPKIKNHPKDFLYLPLKRLVRFERVFTSFSRGHKLFSPLLHILRSLRHLVAGRVQKTRRRERARILTIKFHTTNRFFERYQWDALVVVISRGYFEQPKLALNTSDVIDIDGKPASFVKETFTASKQRILRLVCSGDEILIWDEIFEHLIGRIIQKDLWAIDSTRGREESKHLESVLEKNKVPVRIVFTSARETCLVEVRGFSACYRSSPNIRSEFIDACRVRCKVVL